MNQLVTAQILHTRNQVAKHYFPFRHFFFLLDLDHLNSIKKYWPFYRFIKSEHFAMDPNLSARESIENHFPGVPISKILLLTNLNSFGYNFNPLSAYFIFEGNMHTHTLYEVGNTFGEQKLYKAFGSDPLKVTKEFYVSPFIPLNAQFEFRGRIEDNRIFLSVKSSEKNKTILTAEMNGVIKKLTPWNLIYATLKVPMAPLKVILYIHYHALRLFLKKIPFIKKDQNIENQTGVLHGPRTLS